MLQPEDIRVFTLSENQRLVLRDRRVLWGFDNDDTGQYKWKRVCYLGEITSFAFEYPEVSRKSKLFGALLTLLVDNQVGVDGPRLILNRGKRKQKRLTLHKISLLDTLGLVNTFQSDLQIPDQTTPEVRKK